MAAHIWLGQKNVLPLLVILLSLFSNNILFDHRNEMTFYDLELYHGLQCQPFWPVVASKSGQDHLLLLQNHVAAMTRIDGHEVMKKNHVRNG